MPEASGTAVCRLDVTTVTIPVDVGDPPGSPAKRKQPRAIDLAHEHHRVRAAQLVATVHDGELQWSGEDGQQFHEVAPALAAFRSGSDVEHAVAVARQMVGLDQRANDLRCGVVEDGQIPREAGRPPRATNDLAAQVALSPG